MGGAPGGVEIPATHHRDEQIEGRSQDFFAQLMLRLGYDPDSGEGSDGPAPRAVGMRIGDGIIAAARDDGANEDDDYADTTDYMPVNPPLVFEEPGTPATNPFRWQELNLAEAVTQNDIPTGSGLRGYIGPKWRDVTPFAITRPAPGALYAEASRSHRPSTPSTTCAPSPSTSSARPRSSPWTPR